MKLILFILGTLWGITFMSVLQINRIKEMQANYIPKSKIYFRITELESRAENCADVKIHTLGDTNKQIAKELRKLL